MTTTTTTRELAIFTRLQGLRDLTVEALKQDGARALASELAAAQTFGQTISLLRQHFGLGVKEHSTRNRCQPSLPSRGEPRSAGLGRLLLQGMAMWQVARNYPAGDPDREALYDVIESVCLK